MGVREFIQEITKFLMAQFIWIQINQDSEHAIHGSQHVSCSNRAKVPLLQSIILTMLLALQRHKCTYTVYKSVETLMAKSGPFSDTQLVNIILARSQKKISFGSVVQGKQPGEEGSRCQTSRSSVSTCQGLVRVRKHGERGPAKESVKSFLLVLEAAFFKDSPTPPL